MRWSLLSLVVIAGCSTGRTHVAHEQMPAVSAEQQAKIHDAETAVTAAREARDAAIRFLQVAGEQDQAAQSQLRAKAITPPLDLRAVASQSKREYGRRLVLLRDSELQLAKDQLRVAHGDQRAEEKLARDHEKVGWRLSESERQRMIWDSQRRDADYARAEMPNGAPPLLLPQPPVAGGANEGPSQGFMEFPQQPIGR
jgi:hypothetical protein